MARKKKEKEAGIGCLIIAAIGVVYLIAEGMWGWLVLLIVVGVIILIASTRKKEEKETDYPQSQRNLQRKTAKHMSQKLQWMGQGKQIKIGNTSRDNLLRPHRWCPHVSPRV